MSPDEAHEALGGNSVISRSTFYEAIKRGQIPHVKVGARRILIPRRAFEAWLDRASMSPTSAA